MTAARDHRTCARCGTELPPHALACPACRTLVHADRMKELASVAERAEHAGELETAAGAWERVRSMLPADSQQAAAVDARAADLRRRAAPADMSPPAGASAAGTAQPWWRRGAGVAVSVVLLLIGKLKFLLLGLTKASTFVSMFAFFAVYWNIYGWPLALGLVVSIYIHEMGHVAMLRRLGIAAGAPLFIPGVGALVMLKQHVSDPIVDARIGLAGPLYGLGAALAALAVYAATRAPIWLAIAQLTGFLNLFNLIPVWQLDGSRGFHALSRSERWLVVAAVAATLAVTGQRMLFLVGGVAVWRAAQKEAGPGHRRTLVTFVVLVAALAWIARAVR